MLFKRDFRPGMIFRLLECEDLSIHLQSYALTYTAKKMQTVRSTLLDHVQDVSYPLIFFSYLHSCYVFLIEKGCRWVAKAKRPY